MTKSLLLLIALVFYLSESYGQDWITLKTPQSGLLGAPVKNVKNGDINFNFALKYDKAPSVETRQGPDNSTEYENMFRNFTTKYFNSTKASVQTVNAHNLKVRYLSQESIDQLQVGGKYVYEGISADSVTITIASKKEFSADISKAIKDISTAITNPSTTGIIEKIAPILDSISYTKNDSIHYKIIVKNPNVYYKVKLIKLKKNGNVCGCNWETNCFLIFTNDPGKPGPESRTRLTYDFTGVKSRTISRYPEFCGRDREGWQFFLKLDKEGDGLHLWIYSTSTNVNNPAKKVIEAPFKDINGKRQWRLERTYMDRSTKGGIIKNVFVEVSAEQVNENSIEIIHFVDQENHTRYLTTLKYPEFKGRYVKQ